MKAPQTLFEQFIASLNYFPATDLEVHSNLLSDLSKSRMYWKCCKLMTRKCLDLENGLHILDQLLMMNQASIFVFKHVFHVVKEEADMNKVFDYYVDAIVKSNVKFTILELQNFDEFLTLFIDCDSKFDLVLERADKQFKRSPESILKGFFIVC
jgi:hypothetical protein